MAVRAVIFDFGGVLTSSPFEAFNRWEAERGLPRDFLRGVNARDPLDNAWALFERGEIDAATFDARFADESARLGRRVRGAEVLPLLSGDLRPGMIAAMKACRAAGLKVGCLTNNVRTGEGAGMAGTLDKAAAVAEVMALFDAVVESSRAGVRKPDPAIYRLMLDTLGVEAADCVYLDDLGINCKPAAALGMTAIKVESEAQALAALEAATGLNFPVSSRPERSGAPGPQQTPALAAVPDQPPAVRDDKGRLGAARALAELPLWRAAEGRDAIVRAFKFKDFNAAFGFMTRAALAAEKLDHHPEWSNVYDRVEVLLTTHDANGVTGLDLAMAKIMDEAAAALSQ